LTSCANVSFLGLLVRLGTIYLIGITGM
jgi:hypothetical protein